MGSISRIILIDVIIEEEMKPYTLDEFNEAYAIDEMFIQEVLEHSLIEPQRFEAGDLFIDLAAFQRLQSALRLRQDLEVNFSGIALILELVDQLKETRRELAVFKKTVAE